MENGAMLNLIVKIHKDGILDKLSLKEAFLVNWAVEDALEAQIPEEVVGIVFREEVFLQVASEVSQLVSPQMHCLLLCMVLNTRLDWSMEQDKVLVVLIDDLVQDL